MKKCTVGLLLLSIGCILGIALPSYGYTATYGLTTVSVTAGDLTVVSPDTFTEYADDVTGDRVFMRINNGDATTKTDALFVLDMGEAQLTTYLAITNRNAASDSNIETIEVYVGDESSGYPSSFDTCVYSGSPSGGNGASVVKKFGFTSTVYKRYFLIKVLENYDGVLDNDNESGRYADFSDIAAWRVDVSAGQLIAMRPDALIEYFLTDGVTRKIIRTQNGADGSKMDSSFVLDRGEAQYVTALTLRNRLDASGDSAVYWLKVYVGDESSGYPSSFDTCIFDGQPTSVSRTADLNRSINLSTPVVKRYFFFTVEQNFDGWLTTDDDWGETKYADFNDIGTKTKDVSAGQISAVLPDSLSEYFFADGVTRRIIRITNGDITTKTDASFVLDQGDSEYVSSLLFKNRLDAESSACFYEIEIYVGDESAGVPASFDTLVYSGIPRSENGNIVGVGLSRYAHLASPISKRYFMVKVLTNLSGPLTTDGGAYKYADFGSVELAWTGGSSVTSHTVTAGSVSALEGDVVSAYPSFGSHGFMVSDGDADGVLYLLVDQGSSQSIDMLQVTNRADAETNLVPKTVRCLVAADEGAAGFDPQLLSSYTVEIASGALDPVATGAGMKRSIDVTDLSRRYMVLEIQSNLGYYNSPSQIADIAFIVPPASVDASTLGYNSTDATDALQAAICSRASVVQVPNMGTDWIVRPLYFVPDQEIVFADGVTIQAKSGEFQATTDCLFTGRDVANLTLTGTNATFKMCMSDYADELLYTAGEWRHAVRLNGCEDVTISGITMQETGGDGIYLGSSYLDGVSPCSNVTIQDVVCDNNYRQGMSVINVDTLLVDDCVFRATAGTAPKCGIDFEPNSSTDVLTDITVKNSVIEANDNHGIAFLTGELADAGNYDALIENCTIYGNQTAGLRLFRCSSSLVVKDCLFVNNTTGILNEDTVTSLGVTYCGFWGNTTLTDGLVSLGTGCVTSIEPIFASTTFGDQDYMYLAATCPTGITEGASDSGYLGAKSVVPATVLQGDANSDGMVDVGDLGILAANYGTTSGATWAMGDFNGDGAVDVGDLGILAANYGTGTSGADFDADYAKTFGETEDTDDSMDTTLCSSLGLSLIAGLVLMALMLVKLEE